jgi:RNA-directed DNA polymerase
LTLPTVADRIVQGAIRHVIEPIFEQQFAQHSYGFRPGRGCKDALRRVDQLLQSGYEYVVDADLKSYFDTIPHDRLMQEMQKSISDGRLLKVIESFLHANIMDGLSSWKPTSGAPQGAVLSPLLSNIYLNALDHLMVKHGMEMVRYADDFVILCRSAQEAQRALEMVQAWTAEAGLTLHPEKTRIVHAATESFDFLGYRFNKGIKYPRPKSLMKLRDAIREKTRRTHGQQLEVSISSINRVLRGWFGYFQHSYRTTFKTIDSWIRMRLRSILRKRRGGRGRGRGRDHQRWLNAYFKDLGLYSLVEAHRLACESLKRVQRPESRMR